MKIQSILRGIRQADQDYDLIPNGSKIAVALSGGKDSMLLFLALSQYQKFKEKDFELIGIHVDVGFDDTDPEAMIVFCKEHDLNLIIDKTSIFEILKKEQNTKAGKIQCSLCSTLKKGVLMDTAVKNGCNRVAFGHHGDDAVETLVMNAIHGSRLATFRPDQYLSRMDMHIIRPMIYVREAEIEEVCKFNNIPAAKKICPNDGHTERQEVKEMLAGLYAKYPMAYDNLLKSLSNPDQALLWKAKQNHKPEKS